MCAVAAWARSAPALASRAGPRAAACAGRGSTGAAGRSALRGPGGGTAHRGDPDAVYAADIATTPVRRSSPTAATNNTGVLPAVRVLLLRLLPVDRWQPSPGVVGHRRQRVEVDDGDLAIAGTDEAESAQITDGFLYRGLRDADDGGQLQLAEP